jgi:2-dehydropantoate 2-reductase
MEIGARWSSMPRLRRAGYSMPPELNITEEEESAARAAGFTMMPVAGIPEFVGGSTWQSLQRGTGNIETDYLNGEVVMIAHRLGMEAPINERLAILARQTAATGAKPGDLNVDQLADLLRR